MRVPLAAIPFALCAALVVAGCSGRGERADRGIDGREEALLGRLDPDLAFEEIRRVSTGLVNDPSGLGSGTAAPGTEQEARLLEHAEERFKEYGLVVERHPFPVRVFTYGPVSLSIAGEPLPAVILYGSPGTWGRSDDRAYTRGNTADGHVLRRPMVYAGNGTRAAFDTAGEVRDRIVLLLRDDGVTGWPSLAILEAARRGAAAVVFFGVEGEGTLLPGALRQDSVLTADPIPAFSIRRSDGERLRQRLGDGPLEAEVACEATARDGTSYDVLGRLRGARFPEQIVMVSAHADRWFTSCQDNASGVGALLELARVLHQADPPEHTLLFAVVGSEEAGARGSVDEWLTGSYALAKDLPGLFGDVRLIVNLDGVGWAGNEGQLRVSPEGAAFADRLVRDLGLDGRLKVEPRVSTWVDAWSYSSIAGATTMDTAWNGDFSDYYHTDHDVCDRELFPNLGSDLRMALLAIDRADRQATPPWDFTDVVRWARPALEADAGRLPEVSFEPVLSALAALDGAATGEPQRRAAAAAQGDAALEAFESGRMATRNRLIPALVAVGEYLAETRTYRCSVDARRLASVAEALAPPGAGNADAGPRLRRVLALIEAGDDFQDAAPTPSWAVQFSPDTLRDINRIMVERRTWSAEHGRAIETVNPGVSELYESVRAALDGGSGAAAFDTAGALRSINALRASAVSRCSRDIEPVAAALRNAAAELQAAPQD